MRVTARANVPQTAGKLLFSAALILCPNECRFAPNTGTSDAQPKVCGKTVVHYGAGKIATPVTLAMLSLCITAAEAGPPPGSQVELIGLSKAELNGT